MWEFKKLRCGSSKIKLLCVTWACYFLMHVHRRTRPLHPLSLVILRPALSRVARSLSASSWRSLFTGDALHASKVQKGREGGRKRKLAAADISAVTTSANWQSGVEFHICDVQKMTPPPGIGAIPWGCICRKYVDATLLRNSLNYLV